LASQLAGGNSPPHVAKLREPDRDKTEDRSMSVADILSGKGRNVVTTTATASVAEAVSSLSKHGIGALVVTDGPDGITGIVSERDIVRGLAAGGAAILAGPISAIMTRAVVTCGEADTINHVMSQMTGGRFRHLPVVTNGRLAGIVSIGDVVKARISEIERDAADLRTYIASS
jgi:CBS domain-containing protein